MTGAPGWWSWSADPTYLIFLTALSVGYWLMYRRASERATKRRPGPSHWLPFAAGVAVLAVSFLSPLATIGESWLISAHMAQHVLAADLAPALLVLGLRAPVLPLGVPPGALRVLARKGPLGRIWGILTLPYVALPLWALCQWIWAIPAVFDAAAGSDLLHAFEHATLFYTGVLLWWIVIDPLPSDRRQPRGHRLAYLGISRAAAAVVCIPLTWMTVAVYDRYVEAPRAYGLSALADQQIAGAAMCVLEIFIFGIAFAWVFLDFLARSDREDELHDRIAARAARR